MSDDYDFVHTHLVNDGRQRAREYVKFVAQTEMDDVDSKELVEMMRDTDLLDTVAAMGVCVTREAVKTQIEATLAMRALNRDAPVD